MEAIVGGVRSGGLLLKVIVLPFTNTIQVYTRTRQPQSCGVNPTKEFDMLMKTFITNKL